MKKTFTILITIFIFSKNVQSQNQTIYLDEFEKGLANPNAQILDVRTIEEYHSGHITNALLADWNNPIEFKDRVKHIDKLKPIYIYCQAGGRSAEAMEWMNANGYKEIYNLSEGFNTWKSAYKPIEGEAKISLMTIKSYDSIVNLYPVLLVDIGAKWCPPCKKMSPVLDQLESEKFNVLRIEGSEQIIVSEKLRIKKFPVFIIYKNGAAVKQYNGITDIDLLRKELSN